MLPFSAQRAKVIILYVATFHKHLVNAMKRKQVWRN